jgi:hypothetical protein
MPSTSVIRLGRLAPNHGRKPRLATCKRALRLVVPDDSPEGAFVAGLEAPSGEQQSPETPCCADETTGAEQDEIAGVH